MQDGIVKYDTPLGEVELSSQIVRDYIKVGNGNITDSEVVNFLNLCRYQKLNPFLREVYLIKYSNNSPATMVTGVETFIKRANRDPQYDGHKIWTDKDWDNGVKIAYGECYFKNKKIPYYVEVDFDEFVGKTSAGAVNSQWKKMPKVMLKKCAEGTLLRKAFPEECGGLYIAEEISHVDSEKLPTEEVKTADATVMNDKPKEDAPTGPACPECTKPMVLRNGNNGKFWGCSTWKYGASNNCKGSGVYVAPEVLEVQYKIADVKAKLIETGKHDEDSFAQWLVDTRVDYGIKEKGYVLDLKNNVDDLNLLLTWVNDLYANVLKELDTDKSSENINPSDGPSTDEVEANSNDVIRLLASINEIVEEVLGLNKLDIAGAKAMATTDFGIKPGKKKDASWLGELLLGLKKKLDADAEASNSAKVDDTKDEDTLPF